MDNFIFETKAGDKLIVPMLHIRDNYRPQYVYIIIAADFEGENYKIQSRREQERSDCIGKLKDLVDADLAVVIAGAMADNQWNFDEYPNPEVLEIKFKEDFPYPSNN